MAQQDDDDTNTRIGLIIAFGASALVVGSVVAGAVYHQLTRSGGEAPTALTTTTAGAAAPAVGVASAPVDMSASAAATAASVSASGATAADVAVVDVPLSGETVGEIFFALGSSALPAKGAAEVERARGALAAAPGKRLVISGFHDASGGAAVNAEIAKQRALAVRAALVAAGVEASRLALRKPELTAGDGPAERARRVEIHLAD